MNNHSISQLQSNRLRNLTNGNSLLKISLGLIFFTILSSAFVYAETMSVDVDGTDYDVDYTVSGMSVSGIESDTDFISLIISVDVTDSQGILDITFDRTFFDSVYEGVDDDFIILADGDEPTFSETETTSQSRTLSIELPAGTEEIEIIGSVFGRTIEDTPVEETPVEETPVEETPVEDTPVEETPVEDTPVEETPVEDTPVEETPVEDTPRTECGPGTILQDGVCVLDERCGPGTILQDGVCVLEPQTSTPEISTPTSTSFKGLGKELGYGLIAAFVVTGAIAIILALMSKAGKSRD
ncbi:hypothetical protein [Nitrosopumilus maritimus]|uniref:Uncharacterized protein n=1 Tax=Nitrosopumilus maritimus (strain SCM1) TaxID=436308 RepID=A9A1H4_NITMS|nr:hypothetical protein [Nitrosopumilus maritimus]ABX13153.1 hypothetical protein Nmar_1257 [Nitrosopumilus maritimus SCM1]